MRLNGPQKLDGHDAAVQTALLNRYCTELIVCNTGSMRAWL